MAAPFSLFPCLSDTWIVTARFLTWNYVNNYLILKNSNNFLSKPNQNIRKPKILIPRPEQIRKFMGNWAWTIKNHKGRQKRETEIKNVKINGIITECKFSKRGRKIKS